MRAGVFLLACGLLAQSPDPAYQALSKAYEALRGRDYDNAIPLFLKALDAAPGRVAIRKDLAYTYLKIGENEAAREQFRQAMRAEPADFHVALEYAFLCFETKEKAEARRILAKIEKDLAARANQYPVLKGQFAGLRKLRVGDYRVIFAILGQDVLVLRIGHRREIYDR